jgi:hypothetical protein
MHSKHYLVEKRRSCLSYKKHIPDKSNLKFYLSAAVTMPLIFDWLLGMTFGRLRPILTRTRTIQPSTVFMAGGLLQRIEKEIHDDVNVFCQKDEAAHFLAYFVGICFSHA